MESTMDLVKKILEKRRQEKNEDDGGIRRILVEAPKKLQIAFKAQCCKDGITIKDLICEFMEYYVNRRGMK